MFISIIILSVLSCFSYANDAPIGHLVPEFEPSQALIVSTGYNLKLKTFVESHNSNQFALENAYLAIDEKFEAYQILIDSLPNERLLFFSDPHFSKNSEKNFSLNRIEPSQSTSFLWPQVSQSLTIDEWIRDFGPLTIRDSTGDLKLIDLSEEHRGKEANAAIGKSLGIATYRPEVSSWQGGDLMTNGDGRCFYSEDGNGYSSGLDAICSSVIGVPSLPVEETGHIDMFAKFLSPKKVLLSKFLSNRFHIASNTMEVTLSCTEEQIENEEWYKCYPNSGDMDGPLRLNIAQGATAEYTAEQIRSYLTKNFPQATLSTDASVMLQKISQADLVGHYAHSSRAFSSLGVEVIPVDSPAPYLSISIQKYQNSQGENVRQVLGLKSRFRSYTNSLLYNGKAFIPSYEKTAGSPSSYSSISQLYEAHGFSPVAVPMDHTLETWGAIHCLTMQVPK